MHLSPRDKALNVVKRLAAFGLEKIIIKSLYPVKKEDIDQYHNMYKSVPHRGGDSWLRSEYHSHMADRVVRVYESVVGDITSPIRVTPEQLLDVTVSYLAMYPKDDMSINRIYHLISNIKNGIVAIDYECQSCEKPFVIGPKRSRYCAACETVKVMKEKRREKACRSIKRYSKIEQNLHI